MERDELGAWIRLVEGSGYGRHALRRLLAAFGSPDAALAASNSARREAAGCEVYADAPDAATIDALVDVTWRWMSDTRAQRHAVVALGEADYPRALLQTADPPLLLYVTGRADTLNRRAIAIVGSRNPTPQGLDNARAFAAALSRAGWTVVSGLALGIDGAAHEGALQGPGGTLAVVGTGPDRVYPRRHHDLAHRIAEHGALIGEFALGAPPLSQHFPSRNRIIAGMTMGTLVVEAAIESGSLITARLASEAGREVFALPGSIHAPQSRGCHALIKQGAKLVETVQDILDELAPQTSAAPLVANADGEAADPLLEALGHDPVSLDALVARTGWPAPQLNSRLLELELEGRVSRLPGQMFQRRVEA